MSQQNARKLAGAIREAIRKEVGPLVDSYAAICTAASTAGVQFRRIGESTGSEEVYAKIRGQFIRVGDEIAVIQVGKHPFVLGVIKRAAFGTPTYSISANAGTGATMSITGNDEFGLIQLVTGTSPASGSQFDFNFASAMPNTDYGVILQPASNAAGDLQGRMNVTSRTTSKWSLNFRTAPTASATYQWFYYMRPFEQ